MALAAITFDHLGTADQMAALRAVVERYGVASTFFVTGERAEEEPAAVRALHRAGHEIGMHGWAHEPWAELTPDVERDLATRATNAIAEAIGEPPRGFRAPGGARTDATAEILDELGYAFDASLGDRMSPTRLSPAVANVPFVWPGVDGYWYLRDEPEDPGVVRDAWLSSLERADLFVTICHPEITAVAPERLAVLDAIVRAVIDGGCEVATVGAIAARIPA